MDLPVGSMSVTISHIAETRKYPTKRSLCVRRRQSLLPSDAISAKGYSRRSMHPSVRPSLRLSVFIMRWRTIITGMPIRNIFTSRQQSNPRCWVIQWHIHSMYCWGSRCCLSWIMWQSQLRTFLLARQCVINHIVIRQMGHCVSLCDAYTLQICLWNTHHKLDSDVFMLFVSERPAKMHSW